MEEDIGDDCASPFIESEEKPNDEGRQHPKLLHQFFEISAQKYPNNIALEWYLTCSSNNNSNSNNNSSSNKSNNNNDSNNKFQLTYRQLNEKSNRLSKTLSHHVHGESVVAIFLPRINERAFVAQLAVMKAGAGYLCIDHMTPDERIKFILSDSTPRAIVTDKSSYPRIMSCMTDSDISVVVYDEWEHSGDTDYDEINHPCMTKIDENRLAYVLYTSGSTGQPKGVLVEHKNICNCILSNQSYFSKSIGPQSRVGQSSSLSFDSSIEETYLAFQYGGTCVILGDELVRSGPDFTLWLINERINVLCPPPTILRMIGESASSQLTDLKVLYVGGEELTQDVANIWSCGRKLINGYGPTECAVTITRCTVQRGSDITIGKPVANIKALILDNELNPVAPGGSGELCISGASVSRGYLNREKLTKEKFYKHPVFGKIYRTGDLVKQNPTGNLMYLGRLDTQVKIRGYRVELSSIESHLANEKNVLEAACVVQKQGSMMKLVGFITTTDPKTINKQKIINHLTSVLPSYMVPSEIRIIDSLPRQVTNKIDRKALSEMRVEKNSKINVVSTSSTLALNDNMKEDIVDDFALAFIESEEKPNDEGCQHPKLLHQFFELSAQEYPDNIAMEWYPKYNNSSSSNINNNRSNNNHNSSNNKGKNNMNNNNNNEFHVTYRQLNEKSNRLSKTLSNHIHGESVVAIFLPRINERPFVAQLAVMKAGAAYLCIDHITPDERIKFILSDSTPRAIVTDKSSYSRLMNCMTDSGASVVVYDEWENSENTDYGEINDPSMAKIEENRLAYIIYTSGSTGQPKGVMVEHRNICNLIRSNLSYFSKTVGSHTRVGQSGSISFDVSVEQIYLAFAFGGTCIVINNDVIRSGPDLVHWLKKAHITLFYPTPTLLRTLGAEAPEILKELSVLYVVGEELTRDVADTWSGGRQLINGYGPAECAVVVTRWPVEKGVAVTIGKPVANNKALILDEFLKPVALGNMGELCISGASVARGYLNREELTAERFYSHPVFGRIYRTGDVVKQNPEGNLTFHGRTDSQVKIHGYRVELSSIESHLASDKDVLEAACVVQKHGGRGTLVAFITTNNPTAINKRNIINNLTRVLPSYMVPSHIKVVESLPRLVSMKIDRKTLSEMKISDNMEQVYKVDQLTNNDAEQFISEVIMHHLGLDQPPNCSEDFFDLGGSSLTAALVVSEFRRNPLTRSLAVRDIYEQRTAEALASLCSEREKDVVPDDLPIFNSTKDFKSPILITFLQFFFLLFNVVTISAASCFILLYPLRFEYLSDKLYLVIFPVFAFVGFGLWMPISILFAVLAKKVLIGRYRPGRYPIWGWYYLRHWICKRYISLIPWSSISGTIFNIWALRLLGARIGKNVHIHRGAKTLVGGLDLLSIGNDVTLGKDAELRMLDYENQEMVIGDITIGNNVTITTKCGISNSTTIGEGAYISALSVVTSGTHVPSGAFWEGVPGKAVKPAPPVPEINQNEKVWSPVTFALVLTSLNILSNRLINPIIILLVWEETTETSGVYTIANLVIVVVICTVIDFSVMALHCRMLGILKPGVYHIRSTAFMKALLKDIMAQRCSDSIQGSLFWPLWLRLAGMQIGPGSEMSGILEIIPELVSMGKECFFADRVYLGGPIVHGGTAAFHHLSLGDNTFVGNTAVIPAESNLPSDILVGVCTVANDEKIKQGTSWFGNPSFQLPQREVVEVDRTLTHNPSLIRIVNRLFWEILTIFLPLPPVLLFMIEIELLMEWEKQLNPWVFYICVAPSLTITFVLGLLLGAVAVKWILLGRMKEGQHVFWSSWCSRWSFSLNNRAMWANPVLDLLKETLMFNFFLRLFGSNIGSRVFVGSNVNFVDPDLLYFEDDTTVVGGFQAHSFEDRVLKKAPLYIRCKATLCSGATMMYGADIGQGAMVGPNSVVMKREVLLPRKYYTGVPTRAANPPERTIHLKVD